MNRFLNDGHVDEIEIKIEIEVKLNDGNKEMKKLVYGRQQGCFKELHWTEQIVQEKFNFHTNV